MPKAQSQYQAAPWQPLFSQAALSKPGTEEGMERRRSQRVNLPAMAVPSSLLHIAHHRTFAVLHEMLQFLLQHQGCEMRLCLSSLNQLQQNLLPSLIQVVTGNCFLQA